MTHEEKVLKWYGSHRSIMPDEAYRQLGIYRLSAVIFNLRARGHDIETERVPVTTRDGETTRVARYWYRGERKGSGQA